MNLINLERTKLKHSFVVAIKEHISSDLDGEAVILNLKTGVYHGLDAVGARIWDLLQTPRTVHELRDILLQEYEVEPERCEHDILILLQQLLDSQLIEVKNEEVVA